MATVPAGFTVTEHIIPATHIREYPHGVKTDKTPLQLAIKVYKPVSPPTIENALTIIGGHANGFAKEMYEPIWEELNKVLPGKIRAVWFADATNQGASGVLNEEVLGDDPHWHDHSRDLLAMVNWFRDEMPRPIVGIAHSMGTVHLLQLSIIHPRLFDSLVLIDPVIHPQEPLGPNASSFSTYKQDRWLTREEAESSFRKSKFYQTFDPRVLNAFLAHGLRDHNGDSSAKPNAVTLTTTRAQEAWSYLRSNFTPIPRAGNFTAQATAAERRQAIDTPMQHQVYLFDRPEMLMAHWSLPFVRPAVLWVFGEKSFINFGSMNDDKLNRTGTGIGGSGGAAAGAVEAVTVPRSSHMVPFEKPKECAEISGKWLEKRLAAFAEEERWWKEHDSGKSTPDQREVSKQWMERVKQKPYTPRPTAKSKL